MKILLIALFLTVMGFLAFVSYTKGLWRFNYVSAKDYPAQGLDVSHHQGKIRWDEVSRERFEFVYMKATEGGDFKDRRFLENWTQAYKNKFRVGAYHFFTLCRPGKEQAKNFIQTVPVLADAMSPVIDLEYVGNCSRRPTKQNFLKELDDYTALVKRKYGKEPVLYTTYEFYEDYLGSSDYQKFRIWIRDILKAPSPKVFPDWYIWQYADNAKIKGIDGPVDLNAMATRAKK